MATTPNSVKDLDQLIKLLKMTTSSVDSEALTAMRMANRVADKLGGWEPLMQGKVTVEADPFAAAPRVQPTQRPAASHHRGPFQSARPTPPPPRHHCQHCYTGFTNPTYLPYCSLNCQQIATAPPKVCPQCYNQYRSSQSNYDPYCSWRCQQKATMPPPPPPPPPKPVWTQVNTKTRPTGKKRTTTTDDLLNFK